MSQTLHQLYRKKAIVLARTMVVKFQSIATTINKDLIQRGYSVDENNPASWKYYMNMAGLYHQYDYDQLLSLSGNTSAYIQIKVAGDTTATTANFTKDLLYGDSGDTALANEYRFNTDYYNTLVSKYPEFEPLIAGILNPVPLAVSTTASDGEILYFGGYLKTFISSGQSHYVHQTYGPITDTYQLEDNEENIIPQLQRYINQFVYRWYNANYMLTENLFQAQFLANLYLGIPQVIMNLRLGNAKTAYAHSFHIQEYLESAGRLGWVAPYLSKSVGIWLYRNLEWLDANRGKQKVFDAIVQNVLTPMNIPIAQYRMVHLTDQMSQSQLTPAVKLYRYPLNYTASVVDTDYVDVSTVISAETQLATDNYVDQAGQVSSFTESAQYGLYDHLPTRVHYSKVVDNSNRTPFSREEMGLNLWGFCASRGLYTGTVIFTNPLNNDRIQLTPTNAYILTQYCILKGMLNITPTVIANGVVSRIPRTTTALSSQYPAYPQVSDLQGGVDTNILSTNQIGTLLGTYRPSFTHASSTSFSQLVTDAQVEAQRQYRYTAMIGDAQGQAMAEWCGHHCYWYQVPITLTTTATPYSSWFASHGIDVSSYAVDDLIALAYAIILAATGVDLDNSEELVEGQSAAITVLKHFSPYTLQFLQDSKGSDVIWTNRKNLRMSHLKEHLGVRRDLPLGDINASLGIRGHQTISHVFNSTGPKFTTHVHLTTRINTRPEIRVHPVKPRIRGLLHGMSVMGIHLPKIDTRPYTRVYSQYSSTPYPYYGEEVLQLDAVIPSSGSLTPPVWNLSERMGMQYQSLTMRLSPPVEVIADGFTTMLTIEGSGRLSPPESDVRTTLNLTGNTVQATLAPPVTHQLEKLQLKGSTPLAYIFPPTQPMYERLSLSSVMAKQAVIHPPHQQGRETVSLIGSSSNSGTLTPPPPPTYTDQLIMSNPTISFQIM